jgi:hypothetical protein
MPAGCAKSRENQVVFPAALLVLAHPTGEGLPCSVAATPRHGLVASPATHASIGVTGIAVKASLPSGRHRELADVAADLNSPPASLCSVVRLKLVALSRCWTPPHATNSPRHYLNSTAMPTAEIAYCWPGYPSAFHPRLQKKRQSGLVPGRDREGLTDFWEGPNQK